MLRRVAESVAESFLDKTIEHAIKKDRHWINKKAKFNSFDSLISRFDQVWVFNTSVDHCGLNHYSS